MLSSDTPLAEFEKDSYLVELARYVVLNPVRAGMVQQAGDWAWSSYRAMVGHAPIAEWLETDWILGQFSTSLPKARAAYVNFVAQGVGSSSIWDHLKGQIFLGITIVSAFLIAGRAWHKPIRAVTIR